MVDWEVLPTVEDWEVPPVVVDWEVPPLVVDGEVPPLVVVREVPPVGVDWEVPLFVVVWEIPPPVENLEVDVVDSEVPPADEALEVPSIVVDLVVSSAIVNWDVLPATNDWEEPAVSVLPVEVDRELNPSKVFWDVLPEVVVVVVESPSLVDWKELPAIAVWVVPPIESVWAVVPSEVVDWEELMVDGVVDWEVSNAVDDREDIAKNVESRFIIILMYILKLPGNVIAVDIVGIKEITSFVVDKFFSFVKIWDVPWPIGDGFGVPDVSCGGKADVVFLEVLLLEEDWIISSIEDWMVLLSVTGEAVLMTSIDWEELDCTPVGPTKYFINWNGILMFLMIERKKAKGVLNEKEKKKYEGKIHEI